MPKPKKKKNIVGTAINRLKKSEDSQIKAGDKSKEQIATSRNYRATQRRLKMEKELEGSAGLKRPAVARVRKKKKPARRGRSRNA